MLKHSVVRFRSRTIFVSLDILFSATDRESQTFENDPRYNVELYDV